MPSKLKLGLLQRWRAVGCILALAQATVAVAQNDDARAEFSEGVYASNPFTYPSEVSLSDVRAMVSELGRLSRFEIFGISYTYDIQAKASDLQRLDVSTCTHGVRKAYLCDAGELFNFERRGERWVLVSTKPGHWVQ